MQIDTAVAMMQTSLSAGGQTASMDDQLHSNTFGSVLTSLQQSHHEQPVLLLLDEEHVTLQIHNLLASETTEALLEQIEANEYFQQIPEIIDGQMIFANEEDLALLKETFDWLEAIIDTHDFDGEMIFSIDLQSFLTRLTEMADHPAFLDRLEDVSATPMFVAMLQMMMLNEEQRVTNTEQKQVQQILQDITRVNSQQQKVAIKEHMPQTTSQTKDQEKEQLTFVTTKSSSIKGKESVQMTQPIAFQQMVGKWHPVGEKTEITSPLIKQFAAMFKRANFGQIGGAQRISIQLYPEHLGQVRVELTQQNGILTARILASTAQGKEMLESQLHQLRQAFVQQNIQVERIDISEMLTETPYERQEHAFEEQLNEQYESEERENQEEEEKTFETFLSEVEQSNARG